MQESFWNNLPKPFFVLAPLANVTDVVFRNFILEYSRPDVLWTEFVSADGLCHPKGREVLLKDLEFREGERPIVAQLFTANPKHMYEAAKLCAELGFDGVDINMGCPDKNVMKQGAGAACMKDAELAKQLVLSAMEGVKASSNEIPVSVKTRLGFNEDNLEVWLRELLSVNPAAITLHARTKKDMSKVPARWARVKRAVEIRNEMNSKTLIIGNGDVVDMADAQAKVAETGCDGVMFGRAIFGNPWLFDGARSGGTATDKKEITVNGKLDVALHHTELYTEYYGNTKSFELLKKHYRAYINNFPLAKELRADMMMAKSYDEVKSIVEVFKKSHGEILSQVSATNYLL